MTKILGLSCGRKMENTEVLLREALMEAKGMGAEVSMIRLLDLDIKPCKGCCVCIHSLARGGSGECIIKDDFSFLDDQIMECDGLIVGAPVFVVGPHGLIKVITDRLGPSHDLFSRLKSREMRKAGNGAGDKGPDERSFKRRVGGFISVGGATSSHWLALGLPLMHLMTMSAQIGIVDQMQVPSISQFGNLVLNPDALARARKLGRNVAEEAMQDGEPQWKGDEKGTCPVCHCNALIVGAKNPVECPICGIRGSITVEGEKISVTFSDDEKKRAHQTLLGKQEHFEEVVLQNLMGTFMKRPDKDDIPALKEKYKAYDIPVLSPVK